WLTLSVGLVLINIAIKGKAVQSSICYLKAQIAIDDSDFYCTHTETKTNPWRLDMTALQIIQEVIITNRMDCCFEQINGSEISEIRIGNSLENFGNNNPICAVIASIPAGASYSYLCPDMEGRYVNIVIPGDDKFLTLCEVEVYWGFPAPRSEFFCEGKAEQSSTLRYEANTAIDDNDFHCTHTETETNPWWRLDMTDLQIIQEVIITNRMDSCFEQINGAEIRIGNSLENNGNNNPICAKISGIPAGQSVSYSCGGMKGHYLNVVIPGYSKNLTLCEVRVYGNGTS
uniref:Fucolectin tachylectin-4 pentraxin-1 domain-containing protein n=1 Tax=Sinocyclocheilus rhinocerous TaxID=307959 RepID=A0A673HFY5_9TELE